MKAAFREVIREYKQIAGKYGEETKKVLKSLENRLDNRYVLSLKIIFHLYQSIYDRIDPDNGSFSTAELNPGPEEVQASVAECIAQCFTEKMGEVVT